MADDSEQALEVVTDYAESAEERPGVASDLKRYAVTSAEFAAIGGALGSVVPGVGTAIGGLVGLGVGAVVSVGPDVVDRVTKLLDSGPKRKRETAEQAEAAYQAYQAVGAERGTGFGYQAHAPNHRLPNHTTSGVRWPQLSSKSRHANPDWTPAHNPYAQAPPSAPLRHCRFRPTAAPVQPTIARFRGTH